MKLATASLGAFILFVSALPALAGPPSLSARARSKLAKGEVIVKERTPTNDEGVAARAMGVIKAPPARVWPAIEDCDRYKEFMPRTKRSEIRGRFEGGHDCFIEVEMPAWFDNLWSVARARNVVHPDGSFTRRWTLVKGTYSHNTGGWSLYPHGPGGQHTLLVYEIDINPDVSFPDWIISAAQTSALPDLFDSIRKRVGAR